MPATAPLGMAAVSPAPIDDIGAGKLVEIGKLLLPITVFQTLFEDKEGVFEMSGEEDVTTDSEVWNVAEEGKSVGLSVVIVSWLEDSLTFVMNTIVDPFETAPASAFRANTPKKATTTAQ